MFKITNRKGFQVTFANGWTVSVQFGYGNYCSNKEFGSFGEDAEPCRNAEIAAWDYNDNWYDFGDDNVKGWVSPNDVLAFMNEIAAK